MRGATEEEEEVEVANRRELRKGLWELLLEEKRLMEEEDEGWRLDLHSDMSEKLEPKFATEMKRETQRQLKLES